VRKNVSEGSGTMSVTGAVVGTDGSGSVAVNGVRIAYSSAGGGGERLVLVHGSWGSHHNWDAVVPGLAGHFRVVAYDRRGHSESERPPGQGSFTEDVADLAALIEELDLAPAWVVGNSAGAVITLQLAAARPDLLRGIAVHEPPMWSLLPQGSHEAAAYAELEHGPLAEVLGRIESGDHAGAAELFVEQIAFGPGYWARLPEGMRRTLIENAPTFLDEEHDPDSRMIDEAALMMFGGPVLITSGDQSPPLFRPVLDRLAELLPDAVRLTYDRAGHIPHVTHPEQYVAELVGFIRARTGARS
jgi:pimeloyl-ACP methyl ester carboxylesterase